MTLKRDTLSAGNAFASLIDNAAATEAASRLYRHNDSGMRFCCDTGERITPEEARIRDARDAARRSHWKTEDTYDDYTQVQEFPRGETTLDDDFDPVLELDPDENYEIDLDDLDIIDADDETIDVLEILD